MLWQHLLMKSDNVTVHWELTLPRAISIMALEITQFPGVFRLNSQNLFCWPCIHVVREELMFITLGTWKINPQLRETFHNKNIFCPRFSAISLLSFFCLFCSQTIYFTLSFVIFFVCYQQNFSAWYVHTYIRNNC